MPPADRRGAQMKAPSERAPRGKYAGDVLESIILLPAAKSLYQIAPKKEIISWNLSNTAFLFPEKKSRRYAKGVSAGFHYFFDYVGQADLLICL